MKLSKYVIATYHSYQNDQIEFLAYDTHSGGYPYWTQWLESAYQFKSYDLALEELSKMSQLPDRHFTDGSTLPASLLYEAAGPGKNQCVIDIYQIELKLVESQRIVLNRETSGVNPSPEPRMG